MIYISLFIIRFCACNNVMHSDGLQNIQDQFIYRIIINRDQCIDPPCLIKCSGQGGGFVSCSPKYIIKKKISCYCPFKHGPKPWQAPPYVLFCLASFHTLVELGYVIGECYPVLLHPHRYGIQIGQGGQTLIRLSSSLTPEGRGCLMPLFILILKGDEPNSPVLNASTMGCSHRPSLCFLLFLSELPRYSPVHVVLESLTSIM